MQYYVHSHLSVYSDKENLDLLVILQSLIQNALSVSGSDSFIQTHLRQEQRMF